MTGLPASPAGAVSSASVSPAALDEVVRYIERERHRLPRPVLETLILGAFHRACLSGERAAGLLSMSVAAFLAMAATAASMAPASTGSAPAAAAGDGPLAATLQRLRRQIVDAGEAVLDWDGVEREIAEGRNEAGAA